MNPEDLLILLAEIAVAYVGFGAIVAALQSRSQSWTIEDRVIFRALAEVALGAFFVAITPHLIASFDVAERTTWAYSSGACLFSGPAVLAVRIVQVRKTFGRASLSHYLIGYLPFLFFLGCNAANFLLWQAAGPYVLGTVTIILQASAHFLVLLYRVFPLTGESKD